MTTQTITLDPSDMDLVSSRIPDWLVPEWHQSTVRQWPASEGPSSEWPSYAPSEVEEVTTPPAATVARERYRRALEGVRQDQPGVVASAVEAFLVAAEMASVRAAVIAPAPDGGVSISFGDIRSKYGLVEIYRDESVALVLSTFGAEPEIDVRPTTHPVLMDFAQALSVHLADE